LKLLINRDNSIIIGKTNEINYNIMASWSIMFYNINFFSFLEKIAQVTNLLYDDKNWTKIYTLNYGVGIKQQSIN
jgi:hypothetical protein